MRNFTVYFLASRQVLTIPVSFNLYSNLARRAQGTSLADVETEAD